MIHGWRGHERTEIGLAGSILTQSPRPSRLRDEALVEKSRH